MEKQPTGDGPKGWLEKWAGGRRTMTGEDARPLEFGHLPSRFRQSDGRGRPSHIVARASPPARPRPEGA